MRKFMWKQVYAPNSETAISLLEQTDANHVMFWASIRITVIRNTELERERKFEFCAFDKNRHLRMSVPNADSIEEAQEAILLFLKSENVISEEDTVTE